MADGADAVSQWTTGSMMLFNIIFLCLGALLGGLIVWVFMSDDSADAARRLRKDQQKAAKQMTDAFNKANAALNRLGRPSHWKDWG